MLFVFAFATGLAIRAAVLTGVDRGKLKDLLMMDMLSTTIGIKAFRHRRNSISSSIETTDGAASNIKARFDTDNSDDIAFHYQRGNSLSAVSLHSTSTDCYDMGSDSFFEPILHRGDRLPVKRIKSFYLDDVNENLVTIEVFEEIEVDVAGEAYTRKELRSMGCFDFLVPSRDSRSDKDVVDVSFDMDDCGRLSVSVVHDTDRQNSSPEDSVAIKLGMCCLKTKRAMRL